MGYYNIRKARVQMVKRLLANRSTILKSRPLFVYFRFFPQLLYRKFVVFSRIQTRFDRKEGVHTDHLTTTVVLSYEEYLPRYKLMLQMCERPLLKIEY